MVSFASLSSSSKMFFVGFLVLSILMMVTMSSSYYVPYSQETNYVNYQEGMVADSAVPIGPAVDPAPAPAPPASKSTEMIPGFSGWFSSTSQHQQPLAVDAAHTPIDSFMLTQGNVQCERTALSTSNGGFLCLTPEQKQMLQTRGGNA